MTDPRTGDARPRLTRPEVERMADAIRRLLDDGDAALTRDGRLRWVGALTALEAVLGERPSLLGDG